MSFTSIIGDGSHPKKKNHCHHLYRCYLLASSPVFVRFSFIFLNTCSIYNLFHVIQFLHLYYYFYLFFKNTQADLCSRLQILLHLYDCKLISRLWAQLYFSHLDIFIRRFLPLLLQSINPDPYFGLNFSPLSQAGQQKSISAHILSEISSSQELTVAEGSTEP